MQRDPWDYNSGYHSKSRRKKRKAILAERIVANSNYRPQFGHKETLEGQLKVCPKNSPKYKLIQKALEKVGEGPIRISLYTERLHHYF